MFVFPFLIVVAEYGRIIRQIVRLSCSICQRRCKPVSSLAVMICDVIRIARYIYGALPLSYLIAWFSSYISSKVSPGGKYVCQELAREVKT